MNKALIDSIGGRDRLEELASFKPSGSNSVNSASREEWMEMARALLQVLDAQEKPVLMPKPERLDGNGYGYYFDMDDVFKALEDANIRYLTVK